MLANRFSLQITFYLLLTSHESVLINCYWQLIVAAGAFVDVVSVGVVVSASAAAIVLVMC